jgi:hypothetical protein
MKIRVTAKVKKTSGDLGAAIQDQAYRFIRRLTRMYEVINSLGEDKGSTAEFMTKVSGWITEVNKIDAEIKVEQVKESPDAEKLKQMADRVAQIRGEAAAAANSDPELLKIWNDAFAKVSNKRRIASKKKPNKLKISASRKTKK